MVLSLRPVGHDRMAGYGQRRFLLQALVCDLRRNSSLTEQLENPGQLPAPALPHP